MSKLNDFDRLISEDLPLIDVRAPVEFSDGAIPGAINLPILEDLERAQVGTVYKNAGKEEAIRLGHQLVSGAVKDQRLQKWAEYIQKNPRTCLYCFRGGLRSQTAQAWLKEMGVEVPLIEGGYKKVRQYFLNAIEELPKKTPWLVISGPTGSGKTQLLKKLEDDFAVLDLEKYASHRGSAFGAMAEQPSQANFENLIAKDLLRHQMLTPSKMTLIEDESRMIGSRYQPLSIFEKIRSSEVIWIDDPVNIRVERILQEYVEDLLKRLPADQVFEKHLSALKAISKKLGGLAFSELTNLVLQGKSDWEQKQDLAVNRVWIQRLLETYYDPIYLRSLDRRQVKVRFRGPFEGCRQYLLGL